MAKSGMTKKLVQTFTKPNNDAFGGFFIPRQVNAGGAAFILGGVVLVSGGNEAVKARNAMKLGKVSYADGPARMTNSFTSGTVPAMMRASGGNYAAFADMADEVMMSRNPFGRILDDYGANDKLISALYNMGGR